MLDFDHSLTGLEASGNAWAIAPEGFVSGAGIYTSSISWAWDTIGENKISARMGNYVCSMRKKKCVRNTCNVCKGSGSECICGHLGSCSCSWNGAPLVSCVFYSPRIHGLYEGKRTEFETAREHWTMLNPKSAAKVERIGEENQKYFDEVLVKHPKWGAFFSKYEDLHVGEKIGEGGQAEIFAATSQGYTSGSLVVKVFKKNVSLRDLEQQWPSQMISAVVSEGYQFPFKNLMGGAFIRDGEYKNRFGFVMMRRWGDLRTFIDQRMLKLLDNNNHGPPFCDSRSVYALLWNTSRELASMHNVGVLHRDIKASNLLINGDDDMEHGFPNLMDFESSLGVLGTGFWRAPEILEQIQMRMPSQEVVFTEKADIYSFGMLCYEIITGCLPFEGQPQNDYSFVLRGERPRLPNNLDIELKKLILDCWQHDPQYRPNAQEVLSRIENFVFQE